MTFTLFRRKTLLPHQILTYSYPLLYPEKSTRTLLSDSILPTSSGRTDTVAWRYMHTDCSTTQADRHDVPYC